MKCINIKEYIHDTYNNPESDIFSAYNRRYNKNPLPYDEFFIIYHSELVGECVWLPFYSEVNKNGTKRYVGREAYVIEIENGLIECLVKPIKPTRKGNGALLDLDEETTKLTPALFFEFQKEYYRKLRCDDKLDDSEYKEIIRHKNLVKICFYDFLKMMSEERVLVK